MRTPRTWYLVGAGLIVSAVTMAIIAFGQMMSTIEGMQRVVVPGRAKITLPAGTSTLFAEQRSVVDGKTYEVDTGFKYRCGIESSGSAGARSDADASRRSIDEKERRFELRPANGQITYSLGDYAGHNAWDVDVMHAGDYMLVCESEKPFAMAIGQGVGSPIVVAIIGLVPFVLGLAVIVFVYVKRRRQARE